MTASRPIGYESAKAYAMREHAGFWAHYASKPRQIDIGYRGGTPDARPLPGFDGIELDTPGYDGFHLPYADDSIDTVHASHVLEHVMDDRDSLQEWFRVLKPGGHLIIMVPHAFLYERRTFMPSRWSPEHRRAYTPSTLLVAVERSLPPNSYRVRHMADVDVAYDYSLPNTVHPVGCLEIEMVLEKINPPAWHVEYR